MPNVTKMKNIYVYLQANNYTIQLYLYTDRKMTKERKQKRERKKRRRKGHKDVNLFNQC